jgi:hypothetical protein
MFSRRLARASCSGGWATVKMPMKLAAMSSAVTSARSSPVTRPASRISSMAPQGVGRPARSRASSQPWPGVVDPGRCTIVAVAAGPFGTLFAGGGLALERRAVRSRRFWGARCGSQ